MKLGYKVIKEKMNTIILIFSVPKSQNCNEEEKNGYRDEKETLNFVIALYSPFKQKSIFFRYVK